MYFRDLVRHDSIKARLIDTAQRGIIPHAQLFLGRDGEGALALAYAYARYLNCSQPGETDACGRCPSCQRFDAVGDPDLTFLFPSTMEGRTSVRITSPSGARSSSKGHTLATKSG